MSQYTLNDIQRWVDEGERLAQEQKQYAEEKEQAEQGKQTAEQELAQFITTNITPLQQQIDIASALQNIQTLPALLTQRQEEQEKASASLQKNSIMLTSLNSAIQPLTYEKIRLQDEQRATEIEKASLEEQRQQVLNALQYNPILPYAPVTYAPVPICAGHHRHNRHHSPLTVLDATVNAIACQSAYRNTLAFQYAPANQAVISDITQRLFLLSEQSRRINDQLVAIEQQLLPYQCEIAQLNGTQQQLTDSYHQNAHQAQEIEEQLDKARRLVAQTGGASSSDKDLTALKKEIEPFRQTEADRRASIAQSTHRIATLARAIEDNHTAQQHHQANSFFVNYTNNPNALFKTLLTKISSAVDAYELQEPYRQPIIIRQWIQVLKNTTFSLMEDKQNIQCAYGLIWKALDDITPENDNSAKEFGVILRQLLENGIQKEDALCSLERYHPITLPDNEALIAEEKRVYEETLAKFKKQLPLTPKDARTNHQKAYFHEKGYALAQAIEAKAKQEVNRFDYKYYNKVLELSCRYLTDQTTHAKQFNSLIIKHSEGKRKLGNVLGGLLLMFFGAGLIVTSVPLMLMSGGLFSLIAVAGAALITLGAKLCWDNREKGVLKQIKTFKNAPEAPLMFTFWAKPPEKDSARRDPERRPLLMTQ